jgi:cytidylate kinase
MSTVIAIDGPAASGKSSVARQLAGKLGRLYVNTGNMYRGVTWAVLNAGFDLKESEAIAAYAKDLKLEFVDEGGHILMLVNGRSLTDEELNSEKVNGAVSLVAQVSDVRTRLVNEQRALLVRGDLVMEGRDIGSIVFPDSPFKFYIDASEEVRAARRSKQGLNDTVAMRDKLDSTRKTAPLIVPEGALRIDSSDLSLDQVVERVLEELRSRGAA